MTDTKRDFLYEFNHSVKSVVDVDPSVVSVFENITNGNIRLCPVNIPDREFVNEVGRCIFIIKKIVADPYRVFVGRQEVVPVSQAQNIDQESVRLTLSDSSLWANKDGNIIPHSSYALTRDYVFINYENAFICQLINLLIIKLKAIRRKTALSLGIRPVEYLDTSNGSVNAEYVDFYNNVSTYIKKLLRLSKEKIFVENNRRSIDMSNVFVTDIFKSDKRYHFCHKFFCQYFKNKSAKISVTRDFRVLYHNFVLVRLIYELQNRGYFINSSKYRFADSGKMFVEPVIFDGKKKFTVFQTNNGIDIVSLQSKIHVEFSKSIIKFDSDVADDCNSRVELLSKKDKYTKVFVAYLLPDDIASCEQALSIGYNDVGKSIDKLIQNL